MNDEVPDRLLVDPDEDWVVVTEEEGRRRMAKRDAEQEAAYRKLHGGQDYVPKKKREH